MLKSIILFVIATYHDYEIWQMDNKIVFLNMNLQKDMFVTQLESFKYKELVNKVCKL
jgi:hypothetical protein